MQLHLVHALARTSCIDDVRTYSPGPSAGAEKTDAWAVQAIAGKVAVSLAESFSLHFCG